MTTGSRDNSKVATEMCLVDVHYYIWSRDNNKVATEMCLVDIMFSRRALLHKVT